MSKKWILLIGLLAIGIVSAVLVSYLSNTTTAQVDVTSPIGNTVEGTSTFSIVGGETVAFNVSTTNLASVPTTGTLTNLFSNDLGMNCSDFSVLSVENFINGSSTGVTDLLASGCNIVNSTTVSLVVGTQPKTWTAGEVEKNVFNATFQSNALGTYDFTSQVLV